MRVDTVRAQFGMDEEMDDQKKKQKLQTFIYTTKHRSLALMRMFSCQY